MTRSEALEILRLTEGRFSGEDLKTAFRHAALRSHPDNGGSDEQFIRVRRAYECLQDGKPVRVKAPEWRSPAVSESRFKEKIMAWMEREGWTCWKFWGGGFGTSGIPDLFCFRGGIGVWIELKVLRRPTEPLQRKQGKRLLQEGQRACVLRGIDQDLIVEDFYGDVVEKWNKIGELGMWIAGCSGKLISDRYGTRM